MAGPPLATVVPDAATFDDLPLSERAREVVHRLGWRAPTPIQQAVLPQLAMGRDVIARAQTGSGKTAAFGLHLADTVRAPGLQALVLAPTRELAVQVAHELNRLAEGAPFSATPVYGGVPFDAQLAALRDPATTCVVATTGRLLDLLARRQVILDGVRHVVIDEADRMLDLGFLPEIERILRLVPGGRQTALFTATMPRKIAQLAHRTMAHPREIEVGPTTPPEARHHRVDVHSADKFAALVALVEAERPRCGLVFTRTREGADQLARLLTSVGQAAVALHGDLDQPTRERLVADLREGRLRLVVATDVAARGLDVPGITHVVNYDPPEEAEQYVHRAGRTARAGRGGRVFTIVSEHDGARVAAAEKVAGLRLKPYALQKAEGLLTRDRPAPPRPPPRGGYAKGAPRRKTAAPPRAPRPDDPAEAPSGAPEFTLPPSRRERRPREDA